MAISGLQERTLVTHVAAASIGRRPYAVAALVAGGQEGGPQGDQQGGLAGLTMHWGCVAREGDGWAPPPAGWHTIPDKSFAAGAASVLTCDQICTGRRVSVTSMCRMGTLFS